MSFTDSNLPIAPTRSVERENAHNRPLSIAAPAPAVAAVHNNRNDCMNQVVGSTLMAGRWRPPRLSPIDTTVRASIGTNFRKTTSTTDIWLLNVLAMCAPRHRDLLRLQEDRRLI